MHLSEMIRALMVTGSFLILRSLIIIASPDAKRLYDDLLRKSTYNKLIRPVGNTSDTLTVKLGIRLTQIIDVVSGMLMYYVYSGNILAVFRCVIVCQKQ